MWNGYNLAINTTRKRYPIKQLGAPKQVAADSQSIWDAVSIPSSKTGA